MLKYMYLRIPKYQINLCSIDRFFMEEWAQKRGGTAMMVEYNNKFEGAKGVKFTPESLITIWLLSYNDWEVVREEHDIF